MDPKKTGSLIAERRKEMQITQQELADRLGVTNKAISRWETGRGYPDVELIPMIAKELSLSVNDLLNGEYAELKANSKKQKLFPVIIIIVLSLIIGALFTYVLRIINIEDSTFIVYSEKYVFLYISVLFFLLSAILWNPKYFSVFFLAFIYTCIELLKLSILPFSSIQIPNIVSNLSQFIPPVVFFLMLYKRKEKNK